jgi:hypothetical protein
VTVLTGLQVPEQHVKCTQQLHTSQGRQCTIVVSYGAKSVHVTIAPVSIPSTVHMLSFLLKISKYLHLFRILRKSIPSDFSFYFCTRFYVSAHILVDSIVAHYHQQSPTAVTTVLHLRSTGLCPASRADTKIPLHFSPPVYYLPTFSCVVHNILQSVILCPSPAPRVGQAATSLQNYSIVHMSSTCRVYSHFT